MTIDIKDETSRSCILVADRDPASLMPMIKALEEAGFELVLLEDLNEWPPRIKRLPALVLLGDLKHSCPPLIALQSLKQHELFRELPVLIVSKYDNDAVISAALNAGADDYYIKPPRIPLLLNRVTQLLKLISTNKTGLLEKDLLELITQSITQAIFIIKENRFEYVNPAFEQQTGYSMLDLRDIDFWQIIAPEYREMIHISSQDLLGGAKPVPGFQFKAITRSGAIKWWETSTTIIEYRNEKMILGIANEISRRKEVEEALRSSEEKFNKTFHDLPIMMVISTKSGIYQEVNSAFTKTLGYTREEVIGHSSVEYGWANPDGRQAFMDILERDGLIQNFEALFRRKDGELITGLISSIVIGIDGANYLLTSMYDITRRKRAEEALRASEKKFNKAFHELPIVMIITTLAGIHLDVNSAYSETLGYSREEVIGRSALDHGWVNPQDRKTYVDMLMREGSVRNLEMRFITKDRQIITALISGVIVQIDGEDHILTTLNDITQRKQAEEAMMSSEEKFNRAFHDLPNAMVISSREGFQTDVNAAMTDLVGYSREELIGNFSINTGWIRQEDRDRLIEGLDRKGIVRNMEITMRRKQGEIITALISAVYFDIGGSRYILSTLSDITPRKQAEEATQVVLDNVLDAIFIHDMEGRLTYVNQNMLKMYDVDADEAKSYTVADYSYWDNPFDKQMEIWHKTMAGEPQIFEWKAMRPKDGYVFPIEAYHCKINYKGQVQIMAMVRDITERKRAEQMIKEANEQLAESYGKLRQINDELEAKVEERTLELLEINQELQAINHDLGESNQKLAREIEQRIKVEERLANTNQELTEALDRLKNTQDQLIQSEKMASLGTMMSGVAHEINTPVGVGVTAASHLEMLTREINRLNNSVSKEVLAGYLEDVQVAARMVLSNMERAARMIRSFKQVSADLSSEIRRQFDVKEYLEEILLSLHPKLNRTKIEVVLDCDKGIVLDSYPGPFSQIITNLLMNSLMHAFDPDEAGTITIRAKGSKEEVIIRYADNGRGMERETLNRIYDPFFTTKRGAGGTGLGMNIVYNVVHQQFNGSITCKSAPAQGTVFEIRLRPGGYSGS